MDAVRLRAILAGLVKLPRETEWVEFKESFYDPEEIGEYISALANSSALHDKPHGFMVWGVNDKTHAAVGTTVRLSEKVEQQQDLEHWLAIHLRPKVDFRFYSFQEGTRHFELIEIPAAIAEPVRFREYEYIRVGSHKKKLRDHNEKAKSLWAVLSNKTFEENIASACVSSEDVLNLLYWEMYFSMLSIPAPPKQADILQRLAAEKIVIPVGGNYYDITNLGAILFARNMNDFSRLARKVLRVAHYRGADRTGDCQEKYGQRGYAAGFAKAVEFIQNLLPAGQVIEQAIRKEVKTYPDVAVRELVANALIHQDFSISGTGPMVEIFDDRIEIRNPGAPFTELNRIIDAPPRSRNEALASLMRRVGVCEERGCGMRRVILESELFQLPPPEFRLVNDHMEVVLYAPRTLADMDQQERIRACYQHAVLLYVSNKKMTNETLRKRFSISDTNYPQASKIIKDTITAEFIKPFGEGSSKKYAKYVPYWA